MIGDFGQFKLMNWILDSSFRSAEQEVLEQVLVQGLAQELSLQRATATQGLLQDMVSIREDFSAFIFVMLIFFESLQFFRFLRDRNFECQFVTSDVCECNTFSKGCVEMSSLLRPET